VKDTRLFFAALTGSPRSETEQIRCKPGSVPTYGCRCRRLSSSQCLWAFTVALPPSLLLAPNQAPRPNNAQPNGARKAKKSRVRNIWKLARFFESSVGSISGPYVRRELWLIPLGQESRLNLLSSFFRPPTEVEHRPVQTQDTKRCCLSGALTPTLRRPLTFLRTTGALSSCPTILTVSPLSRSNPDVLTCLPRPTLFSDCVFIILGRRREGPEKRQRQWRQQRRGKVFVVFCAHRGKGMHTVEPTACSILQS